MVSAIGPSIYASPAVNGPSAAGLQSQLDRYQQQLSDCVNCSSAKTLEGKEEIQALSGKIGEIKARIEKMTSEKSNTQPAALNAGAPGINDSAAVAAVSASGSATATVGSLLNVFA